MTTSYTDLIDAMQSGSDQAPLYQVTIPEDWMQGRTTYGGLTAALCLEGVLKSYDALPPLRSAQISFIGPAGGTVSVTPSLLRQGKSVTFAGADLHGEKGLAGRAVFAFGAGRASQFDVSFTETPSTRPPEACEDFFHRVFRPPFAQHYESRLMRGGRPVSGSAEHDHFTWVRHRDEAATSISAVLALADMMPPAILPMFTAPAPVSSMTWMLNFLTETPSTRDGWWLFETRAENAAEGYSSQDMMIWNRDLEPVIAGRQSVTIFA